MSDEAAVPPSLPLYDTPAETPKAEVPDSILPPKPPGTLTKMISKMMVKKLPKMKAPKLKTKIKLRTPKLKKNKRHMVHFK